MRAATSLTRSILTRSIRPFEFKNEFDNKLSYGSCESLGLYVHIPFCRQICSFCPYCKELYSEEKMDKYIDSLLEEIRLVGNKRRKKRITSLYFGGGSPALAASRIGEIVSVIGEYFVITEGIGIELHPDDVNPETLSRLKSAGVTKISIGIQSFQDKFLTLLGRKKPDRMALAKALKNADFETVSMDFIFALPNQTLEDLKSDIELAFSSGANHIAIYPFIDFTFTKSPVKAMKKADKRELLDKITLYCRKKGYRRDSIWTFSNSPSAKYSSMTRENFLGFGCSAATLLKKQFKINTFSVEEYCKRIKSGKLPTSLTLRFTMRQRMVYWLFWAAYSTKVDSRDFKRFFGASLEKCYGTELKIARDLNFITESNGVYQMTLKGAFYYHYYENYYTLSYIDKMWGVMRKVAFPEKLVLK